MPVPTSPLLHPSPYQNDDWELIGRDPRSISFAEYTAAGIDLARTPTKSIRQKCLDCSGGSVGEVRKCIATGCALWPFRMGQHPLARKEAIATV